MRIVERIDRKGCVGVFGRYSAVDNVDIPRYAVEYGVLQIGVVRFGVADTWTLERVERDVRTPSYSSSAVHGFYIPGAPVEPSVLEVRISVIAIADVRIIVWI